MSQLHVNVIHRADPGPVRLEALQFQQSEAHQNGLRTTILMTYGALFDPDAIAFARAQRDAYGDEIGIHLHELMCADYRARFQTEEKAFYLLSTDTKRGVLDFLITRFAELFGTPPRAIGSYILDAATLGYLRTQHPAVKVAIISCFEEGVRMYQGNNQEWYLFSDGGPWGPYYPAKECHLCPAHDESDSVGILGLPHLNRDMVLSLTSRDDLFASHPVNLVRAKVNDGDRCDYLLHFIDQWIDQLRYNSFGYYSLFVSTPWLTAGHPFVDDHRNARRLYAESLAYLKDRQDAGAVRCTTMSEFADWHQTVIKPNRADVNLSQDLLCDSGRQMFWFADSHMRVAIDLNAGGAICDLRPYVGRVDRNIGPDSPSLWNGNYPFLISSGLRGGYRTGPTHTCELRYQGKSVLFSEGRTTGQVTRDPDGKPTLTTAPFTLRIGDLRATVSSSYRFVGDGTIEIVRALIELSDPAALVELRELHRGCWGTTEYPEDLRGIILRAEAKAQAEQTVSYEYRSRRLAVAQPTVLIASIPQLKCTVTLVPLDGADEGEADEGYMFRPFYTLALSKTMTAGESLKSRLQLTRQ